MTIIEKRYNIKTFDEFSRDEQAEIIERHRYINIDDGFSLVEWNDSYVLSIEEKGFKNSKIYYDLSCSQGSGACFDSNDLDFNTLLKDFECKHKQWIIDLLNDENYVSIQIEQNHYANHYTHSRTRNISLMYFRGLHICNRLQNLLEDVQSHIEKVYLDACSDLYHNLQRDFDYLISNEAVKETLIANDYCFNEFSYKIEQ